MDQITALLNRWSDGDAAAAEQVVPLLYPQLQKMARMQLRRERSDHTLQPTELVHEAFMRLSGSKIPSCESRAHFYSIAANLMRQILVDHARERSASKRGSGQTMADLDEAAIYTSYRSQDLLSLNDALTDLATKDPRKSQVIELKFFAGLKAEEIGELLGLSLSTVARDLRFAEAWLRRQICP